jgi:hypothetical protein
VANRVPAGQVNRTLTHLALGGINTRYVVRGESVLISLASRCINLDRLGACAVNLDPDHLQR